MGDEHARRPCPRSRRPQPDAEGAAMTTPKHLRAGEGRTYRLGRITLTFKAGGADTGGAYTLCEAIEPPEAGAGLHPPASYYGTPIVFGGPHQGRPGQRTPATWPGEHVFL